MDWRIWRSRWWLLVLVLSAGLWTFVEVADEVLEGETARVDEIVLLQLRNPADRTDPIGPRWVEEMGRDFTALGGVAFLTFLTIAVSWFLVLDGKKRLALVVAIAVGGGLLVSLVLKRQFDRPRPDLVPHGSYVYTASFPSGHAMMSAVAYLTLAALLARAYARRILRIYLIALASFLAFVVGVSRVYLGVHWPTDVLAGWAAGATWAASSWLATLWLQLHGTVEPADGEQPGEKVS